MAHDVAVVSVRGSWSFWAEYDALADDDPRKREIRETAFALAQGGVQLPGTRSNTWAWGEGEIDGYSIDLEGGSGWIAYAELMDPRTGETFIGLVQLMWYPGT